LIAYLAHFSLSRAFRRVLIVRPASTGS